MHVLWGVLMMAIGVFMFACGRTKSAFFVYRLMAARSTLLWGEKVHRVYQVVGVLVSVFGGLVALGFL